MTAVVEPVRTALQIATAELGGVFDRLTEPDLRQLAAAVLAPSGTVFVGGQGRSGLVAAMVAMRLMHLDIPVHAVGEATTPAVRAGDTLVLLSRSGTTQTTALQARRARAQGAELVVVTEVADAELAALADIVVVLDDGPSRQFGGTRFEQAALLVFDAVVLAAASDPDAHHGMGVRHDNLH